MVVNCFNSDYTEAPCHVSFPCCTLVAVFVIVVGYNEMVSIIVFIQSSFKSTCFLTFYNTDLFFRKISATSVPHSFPSAIYERRYEAAFLIPREPEPLNPANGNLIFLTAANCFRSSEPVTLSRSPLYPTNWSVSAHRNDDAGEICTRLAAALVPGVFRAICYLGSKHVKLYSACPGNTFAVIIGDGWKFVVAIFRELLRFTMRI